MSESTDSSPIDAYLDKARQACTDEEIPDGERLRELAESVEMTTSQSEEADRRARELTGEAAEAIDNGESERAEDLLRDAVLLSPVRVQPLYLLADLYAERHGDDGQSRHRQLAVDLAERARELDPDHEPTRSLIDKLGNKPSGQLPWKKAAIIVVVAVGISGSLQLCHREFMTPEVDEEEVEEVREHFEQKEDPTRDD